MKWQAVLLFAAAAIALGIAVAFTIQAVIAVVNGLMVLFGSAAMGAGQ